MDTEAELLKFKKLILQVENQRDSCFLIMKSVTFRY